MAAEEPILQVDSPEKVPEADKILNNGNLSIVLVYADWCGACSKFRKSIWEPMCKKGAKHNRLAIRDDMVSETPLANAKFDYLPSILVVDEKGELQTFERDGAPTNAAPTPRSLEDMTRMVNVPVRPLTAATPAANGNMNNTFTPTPTPLTQSMKATPEGTSYTPQALTVNAAVKSAQKGGGRLMRLLARLTRSAVGRKRRTGRRQTRHPQKKLRRSRA